MNKDLDEKEYLSICVFIISLVTFQVYPRVSKVASYDGQNRKSHGSFERCCKIQRFNSTRQYGQAFKTGTVQDKNDKQVGIEQKYTTNNVHITCAVVLK